MMIIVMSRDFVHSNSPLTPLNNIYYKFFKDSQVNKSLKLIF